MAPTAMKKINTAVKTTIKTMKIIMILITLMTKILMRKIMTPSKYKKRKKPSKIQKIKTFNFQNLTPNSVKFSHKSRAMSLIEEN